MILSKKNDYGNSRKPKLGCEIVVYIIILLSLTISNIVSVIYWNQRNKYFQSMILALCINTLILLTSFWLIYQNDYEAMVFGLFNSDIYILLVSIPLITWVNLLIIPFVKSGGKE